MNFLNFFFITSNLFLIGIWIANFIGIINNGITQDSKYFTVNIFLVIPIWLFIWFKLAQKQNKETEKNLENY